MIRSERELHDLIGGTYDAALEPARWPALLTEICDAFGATSAVLTTVWQFATPLETWSTRFDPDCLATRFERFATPDVNPGMKACASMRIGQVVPRRQFASDEAFTRNPSARAILLAQGLFHSCLSTLGRNEGIMSTLGLYRSRQAGDFSAGEVEELERLTPHLVRSLAFRRRADEADLRRCRTEQALDRLDAGFLLLARGGRVLLANDAARTIVAGHQGLALRHDRLVAKGPCDGSRLAALLAAAEGAGEVSGIGGAICLSRGDERPPVQLWATPLPAGGGGPALVEPEATVYVMLVDPERAPTLPSDVLQSLCGLTSAEARLTRALVGGDRLEDYAARVEISMNTARTHLKAVFAKTETSRQADLVRLLVRTPRRPEEK